jgi:hypothetical protein
MHLSLSFFLSLSCWHLFKSHLQILLPILHYAVIPGNMQSQSRWMVNWTDEIILNANYAELVLPPLALSLSPSGQIQNHLISCGSKNEKNEKKVAIVAGKTPNLKTCVPFLN